MLVASGSHMKAVLTCLEPGQFIPVHHPGIDMLLIVPEGEGEVVSGDRQEAAHPETVISAPADEARGVRAETRLIVLHVVSPPPPRRTTSKS